MLDITGFIDVFSKLGPTGMAGLFLYLLITGWLVPKGQITEERKRWSDTLDDRTRQRDKLLDLILRSNATIRTAVEHIPDVVQKGE